MPDASAPLHQLTTLPYAALARCALNSRVTFDETEIGELADSIVAQGLLQNLVVRQTRHNYEVVAGERRWRAIGKAITDGRLPCDYEVACQLRDLDDLEVLDIIATENGQRVNLHPLEEAANYLEQKKRGRSAADIAARNGKSKRHVERYIALVEKLDETVQAAFAADEMTLAQARVLTSADAKFQKAALKNIREAKTKDWMLDEVTPTALQRGMIEEARAFKYALFDRALYDGEVLVDDEDKSEHAADVVQYDALQKAAIGDKIEALKQSWKFVEVLWPKNGHHSSFHSHEWETSKDKEKAGAVIEVQGDGEVKIHTGLVKAGRAGGSGKSPGYSSGRTVARTATGASFVGSDTDATTKGHNAHAQGRKTIALQHGVANDLRMAKVLLCLALADDDDDDFDGRRGDDDADDVVRIFRERGYNAHRHPISEVTGRTIFAYGLPADPLKRYAKLRELSDEHLDALMAALIARQIRTWCFEGFDELGDGALAIRIAADLGIAGNEHNHSLVLQADDLDGLRNNALRAVCAQLRLTYKSQPNGPRMKADILNPLARAGDQQAYVLPTLRFGKQDELKEKLLEGLPAPTPIGRDTSVKTTVDQVTPLPERAAAGRKKPGKVTIGAGQNEMEKIRTAAAAPKKKATAKAKPAKKVAVKKAAAKKPAAKKTPAKKPVKRGIRK